MKKVNVRTYLLILFFLGIHGVFAQKTIDSKKTPIISKKDNNHSKKETIIPKKTPINTEKPIDSLYCTMKQLYLYEKADDGAKIKVIDTLHFAESVIAIDKFEGDEVMKIQHLKPISRDNIAGYWLHVQHGKVHGWVFSGRLTDKIPHLAKDDILVLSLENEAQFNPFFYKNLNDYHLYTLENKGNKITMQLRKITVLQYNTTLLTTKMPLLTANLTTKNRIDSVLCVFGLNKKKYKWDVGQVFGACPAKFAEQPALSFKIDAAVAPSQLQIDLPTTDWQLRLEIEPLLDLQDVDTTAKNGEKTAKNGEAQLQNIEANPFENDKKIGNTDKKTQNNSGSSQNTDAKKLNVGACSKNGQKKGQILEVKSWKLWYQRRDGKQKQIICQPDRTKKSTLAPSISLDFFGDLDRDNKLDLLLRIDEGDTQTRKLYLSSFALKNTLLREMTSDGY